jgi:hypothetical protein
MRVFKQNSESVPFGNAFKNVKNPRFWAAGKGVPFKKVKKSTFFKTQVKPLALKLLNETDTKASLLL